MRQVAPTLSSLSNHEAVHAVADEATCMPPQVYRRRVKAKSLFRLVQVEYVSSASQLPPQVLGEQQCFCAPMMPLERKLDRGKELLGTEP